MIQYKDIIASHGGDRESFFSFDNEEDQLHLLPYATLTAARGGGELSALIGVYEWQNGPLFMLADSNALGGDPEKLRLLRRLIAMRGDAPYLAVVQASRLTVYGVGLDDEAADAAKAIHEELDEFQFLIPHIINQRPGLAGKQRWISDVILKLLTEALDALIGLGIDNGDAISLVGRALFTRFLADRKLLDDTVKAMGASGEETLFDTHDSVAKISKWLDVTFNGDLLPLSEPAIRAFPEAAFRTLGNVMRRAAGGQLEADWSEDWAKLDFAHIPVGVLSQAYEQYLGKHQQDRQKKEGSFYTPRHIAELMVHASFAALKRDGKAHEAKVLDPAAGAGVFLITAFRELVRERWRHDGKRPDTNVLRQILYAQIRGFDINDSALRFAALGLYLISIELDPEPTPVEKLKFPRKFEDEVLFNLARNDEFDGLGSLGGNVGQEHQAAYDLVVGNPPWSKASISDKENDLQQGSVTKTEWRSVEELVLQSAQNRLNDGAAVTLLPNNPLDLPFVWRAMEWAKPTAQIAFALHARLLFQRGEGMDKAFSALCQSIDITAIINGSEVRQSKVWPNIDAPFCLLFARNTIPHPGAAFRFVSPHLEGPLNDTGGWRIDALGAEMISHADIENNPATLKCLYRGTSLDLDLLAQLNGLKFDSLESFWEARFARSGKRLNQAGNGYQSLKRSSRMRKHSSLKGVSADYLKGLPEVPSKGDPGLLIDETQLPLFCSDRIHDPRDRSIFEGPLLLVRKAPPKHLRRIRTSVCDKSVIYKASYYGYSTIGHSNDQDLARFLCLIIGSKFSLWYVLISSGEYGFERDTIEKYVIEEILVPNFEKLSDKDRKIARSLFDELARSEKESTWAKVDLWVSELFGLSDDDVQTVFDTLAFSLPFDANAKAAQAPVQQQARQAYSDRLAAELRPWSERYGRNLNVEPVNSSPLSPWEFVAITANPQSGQALRVEPALKAAMQGLADDLSSSEVIYHDPVNDCLYLGRLNQARYWSISQARLAARRIIWEHVDFLAGKSAG